MRLFLIGTIIAALLAIASLASAQTTIAVDINKAKLQWTWTKGTGGDATEFRVKCGPTPGNWTKVTIIADPTVRTLPVKTAITGSGNWTCTVTAANSVGESGEAPPVSFFAGDIPSAPTSIIIIGE